LKRNIFLLVGRIIKPHGRRGEVAVYLYNEENSILGVDQKAIIARDENPESSFRELTISNIRKKPSSSFVVSFDEITSIDQALELTNTCIFVDRNDVPAAEDEIFVADLGGMDVYESGGLVGRIEKSYSTAAGEILVINTGDGLVDFPLCDDYLEFIDTKSNKINIKHFGDFIDLKYTEKKKGQR
jgi:16S rRNA processing protein RimM